MTLVRQVRRRLHHAPHDARGANAIAFAGLDDKVVVFTIVTSHPDKTMREEAAFQIFAKRLAHMGLGRVVVALPVELACAWRFHARSQNVWQWFGWATCTSFANQNQRFVRLITA